MLPKWPYRVLGSFLDRTYRNNLNDNFKDVETDMQDLSDQFNNAVDTVSNEAFSQVVDSAKLDWLAPVDTSANLETVYPAAIEGNTSMARDTGKVYRFDGSVWNEIQDIDPAAINEVDNRLSAQLAEKEQEINTIQTSKADQSYVDTQDGDLQTQINNMVLQAGDSSTEVLQARSTFTTLNDRITYQEDKIHTLEKPLENLVVNGDFSNTSLTDVYVGANITDESVANNVLTFTGVGYGATLANTIQNKIKTQANHVYYLFAKAKYTNTAGKIYMGIFQDFDTFDLTTAMTRYSSVLTATTGGYFSFTFAADSGVDVSTQYWGSIDLTEGFGAGNEPTKEYMDYLFSQFGNSWFNGESNVLTADFNLKSSQKFYDITNRLPSNWEGANASFVGDSITEGDTVDGSYVPVVKDLLGLSVVNNYGIGGGRLCATGDPAIDDAYTPLVWRYQTDIDLTSDIVFVLIGTNDYASQVPLGSPTSTLETEFNGALNIIMDWYRDNLPDKLVIFSTLLHRYNDNQYAITMDMYRDAIRERCEAKHFLCYDAYMNTGFDFTAAYYDNVLSNDGLHPNTRGNEILGRKIAGFINAQ